MDIERMKITDLSDGQAEDIETRLSSFDENHITYKTDGSFEWFQGKETIAYRGEPVYECFSTAG